MNFKVIRIFILLLILCYVGLDTLLSHARVTSWKNSLRVVIYPVNADGSTQTENYISQLDLSRFDSIKTILKTEAFRYGLKLSKPITINLADQLKSLPPELPQDRNMLNVMWWSLKLRFWSWKEDNYKGIQPHIRVYALFFNPQTQRVLAHSTGLEKGKIAVIQLFASNQYSQQNNVIIFHELLHTLGATDKYNMSNNLPVYPDGYADPESIPLYPQRKAEIMGGRIALSETKASIPPGLSKTVIGPKTAEEIGWVK
tara:strand:- start:68 stop:838 length:771 start_codon:yes stop_codon:yes gene_type:complete